jgi:hypothetical protein
MHKIFLDGVTRFCETSELSFFKKLGYQEIDDKPKKVEEIEEVEEIEKPKAKKGTKKGV